MVGVAAASTASSTIVIAGIAGLAAGAMSMAVGEYVSVSSQRDSENADLERERAELKADPEGELAELTEIYKARGLDDMLAAQVARRLMEKDALAAHSRDELGLEEVLLARPLQAGVASAISFTIGSLPPIITVLITSSSFRVPILVVVALITLALLGAASARLGGARVAPAVLRLVMGGAVAMAITGAIGKLAGVAGL
jgi:VIT1/CCC1 family predicted Fe2+/Mn2+ transporter